MVINADESSEEDLPPMDKLMKSFRLPKSVTEAANAPLSVNL